MNTQKSPKKAMPSSAGSAGDVIDIEADQLGAFDGSLTDFVTEAMKLPEARLPAAFQFSWGKDMKKIC